MLWTKQSTLIYKLLCVSLCRLWFMGSFSWSTRQVFFSSLHAVCLRALLYWPEFFQIAVTIICPSLHWWGTKLSFLLLTSDWFLWKERQLFIIHWKIAFLQVEVQGISRVHYMQSFHPWKAGSTKFRDLGTCFSWRFLLLQCSGILRGNLHAHWES